MNTLRHAEKARKKANVIKALTRKRRPNLANQQRTDTLTRLQEQKWPPPLPLIKSDQLKVQAFTHKSVQKPFMIQSELVNVHNENLEFIGGSIVNFVASKLILNKFPSAPGERKSELLKTLTCNKTMAEYSNAYNLTSKLAASGETTTTVLAAQTMNAYVGALYMDPQAGIPVIETWFEKLVQPLVEPLQQQDSFGPPINRYAKQDLYALVKFAPQYNIVKFEPDISRYEVDCCIRGSVVGTGIGYTASEAGTRAAMDALNNPDVIKLFGSPR